VLGTSALVVQEIVDIKNLILEKPRCLGLAQSYILGVSTSAEIDIVVLINLAEMLEYSEQQNLGKNQNSALSHESQSIFIVDDSALMRQALGQTLKQHFPQYVHQDFEDASQMLAYLDKTNCCPAVIITDLEMPYVNGFELIEQSKNLFNLPPQQFIVVSSKTTLPNKERAKTLGVKYFMSKPYREAALVEAIQTILTK